MTDLTTSEYIVFVAIPRLMTSPWLWVVVVVVGLGGGALCGHWLVRKWRREGRVR